MKGDSISCSINNKVLATHTRADVVAAGKLKSTDGHYGSASATTPTPPSPTSRKLRAQ